MSAQVLRQYPVALNLQLENSLMVFKLPSLSEVAKKE